MGNLRRLLKLYYRQRYNPKFSGDIYGSTLNNLTQKVPIWDNHLLYAAPVHKTGPPDEVMGEIITLLDNRDLQEVYMGSPNETTEYTVAQGIYI